MKKGADMKRIYYARRGSPFKEEDAQAIGEYIFNIERRTPENILKITKKDKDSPLNKYIDWDDKVASQKWRLDQIRQIVNHVVVEIRSIGDGVPVRAFYSVTSVGQKGVSYVDVRTAFSNEHYRNQIVSRAIHELENWNERYRQYKELKGIVKILDEKIKKIKL
jgi:hypothetical protein